jgi:histidinol-phosphate aminotransferase
MSAKPAVVLNPEHLARPEVRDIAPYVPGKPQAAVEREHGVIWPIKLASNENPLGPSPLARQAIVEALHDLNRYPEGGCFDLTGRLARIHEVEREQIVIGNGSNEIIELIAHVFLGPGQQAILADPTFPMYRPAVRVTGGDVVYVPSRNLTHDLEAMRAAITADTRLVFICNPNNPTGTMVTADAVARFMDGVPEEVLVVFDEAYYEYVERPDYPRTLDYVHSGRHVAILRTFSKIHALAGLRVGYTITQAETASLLHRVRLPFNVSTLAQRAALASLDDPHQIDRSRLVAREGKAFLGERLPALGVEVTPGSETNFLLVRFPTEAEPIARELERRGVIVRPMRGFRLPPDYARITIGLMTENERLLAALSEILERRP